jgi:hypothetical protein
LIFSPSAIRPSTRVISGLQFRGAEDGAEALVLPLVRPGNPRHDVGSFLPLLRPASHVVSWRHRAGMSLPLKHSQTVFHFRQERGVVLEDLPAIEVPVLLATNEGAPVVSPQVLEMPHELQ